MKNTRKNNKKIQKKSHPSNQYKAFVPKTFSMALDSHFEIDLKFNGWASVEEYMKQYTARTGYGC